MSSQDFEEIERLHNYSLHLVEMLDAVKSEGERSQAEFNTEWRNEWQKQFAKILMG